MDPRAEPSLSEDLLMTGVVVANALLAIGGAVAIAAPTDGQTGMVVFPLWGLSLIPYAILLDKIIKKPDRTAWKILIVSAVLSVIIVVGSVVLSEQRADEIYAANKGKI